MRAPPALLLCLLLGAAAGWTAARLLRPVAAPQGGISAAADALDVPEAMAPAPEAGAAASRAEEAPLPLAGAPAVVAAAERRAVSRPPDGADPGPRIIGEPPAALHGRVYLAGGPDPGGLDLRLLRIIPGSRPDAQIIRQRGQRDWAREPDYEFWFPDLAAGSYAITATTIRDETVAIEYLEHDGHGTLDVALRQPALPATAGRHVAVRVTGPGGWAPEGLLLGLSVTSGGEHFGGGGSMIAPEADGSYRLEPDAPWAEVFWQVLRGERFGSCQVHAWAPDLGGKRAEVSGAGQPEVAIRFVGGAKARVRVTGLADPELRGMLRVLLVSGEGEGTWSGSGPGSGPDEDCAWLLDPVQAGDYELELQVEEGRDRYSIAPGRPVHLEPGFNHLAVECPPLYDLTIVVPGEGPRTKLRIKSEDHPTGTFMRDVVDPSGRVTIRRLPAGTYDLRVFGRGGGHMKVVVPAAGEVLYRPMPGDG